jgi:hypothetical protein
MIRDGLNVKYFKRRKKERKGLGKVRARKRKEPMSFHIT